MMKSNKDKLLLNDNENSMNLNKLIEQYNIDDTASMAIELNPFFGSLVPEEDFYDKLVERQQQLLSKDANIFSQKQKQVLDLHEKRTNQDYLNNKAERLAEQTGTDIAAVREIINRQKPSQQGFSHFAN